MMKNNQNGAVGVIEILLIVVLLCFAGFVAWRVALVDETVSDTEVNSTAASDNPNATQQPNGVVSEKPQTKLDSFTHSQLGYSVDIPQDWSYEEQKAENIEGYYKKLVIQSLDYLDEPDQAYRSLEAGVEITVTANEARDNPFKPSDLLNNTSKLEFVHQGIANKLKVDGVDAVQIIWAWEGDPSYRVSFHKDGVNYRINMLAPIKFDPDGNDFYEQYQKHLEDFETVVNSFAFN